MAGDKKASEEPDAAPLGAGDFWAGVQAGRDVKMSVGQVADHVVDRIEPTVQGLRDDGADLKEQLRKLKVKLFLNL
jgi:hypothetical protein